MGGIAPAAWAALWLCGGAVLSGWSGAQGSWRLATFALTAVLACVILRWLPTKWRASILAASLFAVGAVWMQVNLYRAPPNSVGHFAPLDEQLVRAELSQVRGLMRVGEGRGRSVTGMADIAAMQVNGEWRSVRGSVRVTMAPDLVPLAERGKVRVLGLMWRSERADNPVDIDQSWLDMVQGVSADLEVLRVEGEPVSNPTPLRLLEWWRGAALSRLSAGGDGRSEASLLLRALVLGDVSPEISRIRDDFNVTGTTHHLAVSGTHIAVVAMAVWGSLRLLLFATGMTRLITPGRVLVLTLGAVLLYSASVAPSQAVTRSALLCLAVALGLMLGRGVSGGSATANLLGAVGLVMVVLDPRGLLSPGFQLTFFVVWALMVAGPALGRLVALLRDRDLDVADAWRPDTARARWRRWKWRWTHGACIAVTAWLASTPITAHHFSQINPWASLASVLLEPFVAISIVAGVVKMLLSLVLPWGDAVWMALAEIPAGWLRWAVGVLAQIPASRIGAAATPGWLFAASLLALGATVLPWKHTRSRVAAWTVAVVLIVAGPLIVSATRPSPQGLELTWLSIGPARCGVLRLGNETALIDCGNSGRRRSTVEDVLLPYLREVGVRNLNWAIMTGSSDPYLAEIDLLHGSLPPESTYGARSRVSDEAKEITQTLRPLAAGEVLRLGNAPVDVLYPDRRTDDETGGEADGAVLRFTFGGRVVLVVGEVSEVGMRKLLRDPIALRADVIVLPLRHPSPDLERRLLEASGASEVVSMTPREPALPRTWCTADEGAVTIAITPAGQLRVSGWKGQR